MANELTQEALVERIELAVKDYAIAHIVDEDLFHRLKVEAWFDCALIAWRTSFRARWPAEELARVRWPADWREAFKARWFPEWALRRWPVKYDGLNLDAVYTRISLPEKQPRFYFHIVRGLPAYRE